MTAPDRGAPLPDVLVTDALRRSRLAVLPGPALGHLAERATVQQVAAHTAIAREGDRADAMYVVASGRVGLRLHQRQRDLSVATLEAGDLLGWSWFVEPHTWQFDAVALEATTLVRLGDDTLHALAGSDPGAGLEIVRVMVAILARRLRDTRVQLLDLFAAEVAQPPADTR